MQQEASDHWLAIVGNDTITVNQYRYRYETAPHTGFGITARRDFLDALIIERLLAHASLDTSARYMALRTELAAEARVESYLMDHIATQVEVTEADVRTHVIRAIRTLIVQAWATDDSLTSARILARVNSGTPFVDAGGKSLDGAIFLNNVEVKWNSTDPALEELAYTLELGESGGPVFADGRWWVLRLLRFEQDRIPSEAVFGELGPWVRDALEARQARFEQPKVIAEAMLGHTMHIDTDGWQWLIELLGENLDMNSDSGIEMPFTALEETSFRHVGDKSDLDQLFVRIVGPALTTNWSRGDILNRLRFAPKPLPHADNPDRFEHDLHAHLRWLIEFAVLDTLASNAGYTEHPRVIRDSRMWSRHLSAREELNRQLGEYSAAQSADSMVQIGIPQSVTAEGQLLSFIRATATSEGIRINQALLDSLRLVDVPVFVRKRHFQNRPATPLPVGQPWAMQIDF